MKIGMFGAVKDIEAVSAAGFDCIEMQVNEIVQLEDDLFRDACQKLEHSGLTCEVLDNPVPLDQVIADDTFDLDYYQGYLKKGVERARKLGVKFYVFGNGRTRSLPVTGDIEKAHQKNLDFMRRLADITTAKDIQVLIEPLAPRVSNVVQSLAQALEYAREIDRSNIGTFLDYRWFLAMNHPLEEIYKFARSIAHVHIDNPTTEFPRRLVPKLNDGHDYKPFLSALKEIHYNGIISVEANSFSDFDQEMQQTLEFFKSFGIIPARKGRT